MKQQAKNRLCQLLEKTQEDRRSEMKVDMKVWKQHMTSPPSVTYHVKKNDTYLEIARGDEKGFPRL
jgi:hypothetical protein